MQRKQEKNRRHLRAIQVTSWCFFANLVVRPVFSHLKGVDATGAWYKHAVLTTSKNQPLANYQDWCISVEARLLWGIVAACVPPWPTLFDRHTQNLVILPFCLWSSQKPRGSMPELPRLAHRCVAVDQWGHGMRRLCWDVLSFGFWMTLVSAVFSESLGVSRDGSL